MCVPGKLLNLFLDLADFLSMGCWEVWKVDESLIGGWSSFGVAGRLLGGFLDDVRRLEWTLFEHFYIL